MYIYLYIFTYTYIRTYMHTHTCVYIYIYMHVLFKIYLNAFQHIQVMRIVYIFVFQTHHKVCVAVCIEMYMSKHFRLCIKGSGYASMYYKCVSIHIYIYIYIYRQIYICVPKGINHVISKYSRKAQGKYHGIPKLYHYV